MAATFPEPRLDIDDGNQATADLHAKEDLLLENYSSENGTVRIPITRAMELIAQRGLPVAAASASNATLMAGEEKPVVQAPLTTGFARTGFELTVMEARAQKMRLRKSRIDRACGSNDTPVISGLTWRGTALFRAFAQIL